MNEKPILFNAEMVGAILDGRKTQTRRVVNVKGLDYTGPGHDAYNENDPEMYGVFDGFGDHYSLARTGDNQIKCPYGKPGDELWVRETFCYESGLDGMEPLNEDGRPEKIEGDEQNEEWGGRGSEFHIIPRYRATEPETELCYEDGDDRPNCKQCEDGEPHAHWKPSIFMPRWASRIQLLIKDVRVERLQDISPLDVLAEGVPFENTGLPPEIVADDPHLSKEFRPIFMQGMEDVWDSINAKKYPWLDNPWVWVVVFEVKR